jgi:hypothetical protein
MNKSIGSAKVTPLGILFNKSYYTCSIAIRKQWYSKASKVGSWYVLVGFRQNQEVILLIVGDEMHVAFKINKNVESIGEIEKESYFLKLNQLKELRKKLYSGEKELECEQQS